MPHPVSPQQDGFSIATVAGGCFWCLEAVYDQMKGVIAVESGYMGGQIDHPTYEAVCSGRTGHAEAVRITFDPTLSVIASYWTCYLSFTIPQPSIGKDTMSGRNTGRQFSTICLSTSRLLKRRLLTSRMRSSMPIRS